MTLLTYALKTYVGLFFESLASHYLFLEGRHALGSYSGAYIIYIYIYMCVCVYVYVSCARSCKSRVGKHRCMYICMYVCYVTLYHIY